MILPLFVLLIPGTLTANNRWSCRSCQEMCSSTASNDSALCKCDADCQVFSDCCSDYTPSSSCPITQLPPLQDGVMLDCISTFLNPNISVLADNEAFLMVSTCPDSWKETVGSITAENCTSPNFTTVQPPVTNTVTGMLYRNEYCALCNGVRELVAWQTNLVCNQGVYNLLTSQNISEIVLNEPDIFQRECQMCAFQTPSIITLGNTAPKRSRNFMSIGPRSCFPRVSLCLPRTLLEIKTRNPIGVETYARMKDKCTSGMLDLVRGTISGVLYRNVDCAVCNGDIVIECEKLPQIIANRVPNLCFSSDNEENVLLGNLSVLPFTFTLSNLGGGMVSINAGSVSASISLDCPEGTAPVGLECRPTQCPEGHSETGGRCAYVISSHPNLHSGSNFTKVSCSKIAVYNRTDYIHLDNSTIILAEDKSVVVVIDYDEFGRPLICMDNVSFLDCPSTFIPLNESDYTHLGDNSIFYKKGRVEVVFYDEQGRPLVCSDNAITTIITSTAILSLAAFSGLQELSYIGCSLSVIGSILILITYTLFRERRTLPGLILMNLCTSILAISFILIAGQLAIQSYPQKKLCSSLAIVLHFSYLSQFTWLNIFSFEIVRKFLQARKLLIDSNKTKNQLFMAYFCIGWFLPLLVIATSITLNFSVDGLFLYGVDKDGRIAMCWINHFESFIITFLIPLILCLSSNLIMFSITTFLMYRASRERSKLQTSNTLPLIRVWLAIFSTTSLTWIFGFLAIFDQVNWMWYPFIIFNSTQGFTMFLAFLCTKNTLRLYLDNFLSHKKKVTVSKNTPTKDVSKEISIPFTTHTSADMLGADREVSVDTKISEETVIKKSSVEAEKI